METQSRSSTSIIIPSLNSPIIHQVIGSILMQDGFTDLDEILVVGKDEQNLLSGFDRLKFVDTGVPVDASTARNIGIDAASGDLLIFLDSDCLPQAGWLAEHRNAHDQGHDVVGGGVEPVGENYWHLTYNLTMFHQVFTIATAGIRSFLPTLNLSVSRHVVEQVGGLDPTLSYSHDLDWTTRMREAGFMPYFWPSAAVRHVHSRETLPEVWRDCAINGHYARQVRLRYKETLHTPFVLQSKWLTLLFSPIIATWATARIIMSQPSIILQHFSTIPAIYLTKIAWCWGAGH